MMAKDGSTVIHNADIGKLVADLYRAMHEEAFEMVSVRIHFSVKRKTDKPACVPVKKEANDGKM